MDISGYKLGRIIDRAGCCTTFNALDAEQSKTVLVKLFSPELSATPAFLSHFNQVTERLVGKRLGHNIPIRNAFVDKGVCAFVTNYYPHSVPQHSESSSYGEEEVVRFGMQLAEALTLLHGQGLVHGGVDPTNIHILKNGDVVLDAVALQRTLPDQDQLAPELRSLQDENYLAPEADKGLTPATDFYALGIVLFELLTGRQPYKVRSSTALTELKRRARYTPLGPRHAHLKPLFDGLLAGDPESRIDSLEGYLQTLSHCWHEDDLLAASSQILQDTETDSGLGITDSVENAEVGRKHRWMIPALSIITVLIAVATYVALNPPQQTEMVSNQTRGKGEPLREEPATTPVTPVPEQPQQTDAVVTAYQQALIHYRTGEYETALEILSSGKLAANDRASAAALTQDIRQKLEIGRLRLSAQRQIEAKQYISPEGDNALASYRQLAKLTTDTDEQVTQGLLQIADYFLAQAKRLLLEQNEEAARQAITEGLAIKSDYTPLLTLQSELARTIQQAAKPLDREAEPTDTPAPPKAPTPATSVTTTSVPAETAKQPPKLTAEAQEQARRLREQQQRALEAKRLAAEQARLAETERLANARRAQQLREERLLQQQREQVLREAEINRLVSLTELALQQNPVTSSALAQATVNYRSLQALTHTDPRLQPLLEKIIQAHLTLATAQLKAKEYTASTSTIQRAQTLDSRNTELQALQATVAQEQQQETAKPEPRAIPVIGTF